MTPDVIALLTLRVLRVSDDEDIENAGDNVEGLNGSGKAGAGGGGGAVKAKTKLKTVVPEMSEEDVTKAVEPLILEYFENNDAMEVLYTLQVSGQPATSSWYQFNIF